jgi:hypothetical protein
MDERVATLIRQGQTAAQDGNLEMARNYLQAAVDLDRTNAVAWLWLAGVLEEPHAQRNALEQVLMLDPDNEHARDGLAQLNSDGFANEETLEMPPPPPTPTPDRAAGTGMLQDAGAGTMTIDQQLRSQLPPQSATPVLGSAIAPVGSLPYQTSTPSGNYVTAAGQNDMPFRVGVIMLMLTLVLGLCLFGAVLLRIV